MAIVGKTQELARFVTQIGICPQGAHRGQSADIKFDWGMAYQLPYSKDSFDRVLSSLVIHHLMTDDRRQITDNQITDICRLIVCPLLSSPGADSRRGAVPPQTLARTEVTQNARHHVGELLGVVR